jgi:hypothetical protein
MIKLTSWVITKHAIARKREKTYEMKILSALKQEEKIVITSENRQEDGGVLVLSYLISSKKWKFFLS